MLKEHAAGLSGADVCRKHGISEATFYKGRSRFGGMETVSPLREATLPALALPPLPVKQLPARPTGRGNHPTRLLCRRFGN